MINTIFILDEHYKVQKVLTVDGLNTFFDDLYTMDLSTGVESYEFYTNVVDVDESNYIMFYYHDEYKLFHIIEIEQEHDEGKIITYCYGESVCLELLNSAVRKFSGEFNCISFFEYLLNGTDWSIGRYSTSLADKVVTVNVDKSIQIWSCIQDYMPMFGYELNTRVIYENGHLKHKLIDIFIEGELGNKTYKRFEYGRNVEGIVKKKDLYEWCTALIIETDAENILDVGYNSNGYVKEKGSDVVLALEENKKYNLGRNYIYASFKDDSPSGQEVVDNAVAELMRRATPHFDYECDTILTYKEFEDISIGDTVYVVDHTFSPMVTLEARVGKLEVSFTDRNKCKCNLTNYKEIKSKIDLTLTAGIKDIVDNYFPITSDGIADGAITNGKIDTTYYQEITADIISASKTVTEQLIAEKAFILDAEIDNLTANKADIDFANVNFANIDKATFGELYASSGIIDNLLVENETITGELVGVTIKGDLIQGNTIAAEKLIIRGEDGLYYQLNVNALGETTASSDPKYQSGLDGSVIIAQSVTADKIDVSDLSAFRATIGGFEINDTSLYSGVKDSVDNATRGIYMDSTGQIAFGDNNNYIKYYQTDTGDYALEISALENITLDSSQIDLHGYVTANGNFSIDLDGNMTAKEGTFSGTITTDKIMRAYGAIYAGKELWGGFTLNADGEFEQLSEFKINATNDLLLEGDTIYLSPVGVGEVIVGDSSSYDNLRARELYAEEIIYSDSYRALTGTTMYTQNLCIEPANGFIEFYRGLGVIRVAEDNHLYLQCGSTSGNTSTEVRCTCYKDPSTYANIRAYNVCATNDVFARGNNISSDRTIKENIEYIPMDNEASTFAMQEPDESLTLKEMYDFVKDELILARYNYIEDEYKKTKVNFIAQDLLYNYENTDSKVGQIIVNAEEAVRENSTLNYDLGNYVSILAGSLKVAIQKIEELEAKINELENM